MLSNMKNILRDRSVFAQKVVPYATLIISGIYGAANSPKLLTIPDAKVLLQPIYTFWLSTSRDSPSLPHRMLAICDVSADPGGSREFMTKCTTIDTPLCLYNANQNKDTNSFKGPGVLVCSIDNMPTQLPREATDLFGSLLLPHMSTSCSLMPPSPSRSSHSSTKCMGCGNCCAWLCLLQH
ncbi:alpha-aminoadipic semialdehyde synthase, mitochondrial-like [Cherax quadricarinatus]|uniref:alpha-aminoadipic semialdehyde synthase, mitochondrial-like n=1 Tax=Cherax quadricarinatus TaxID=27406 RepID=UPI00387E547E